MPSDGRKYFEIIESGGTWYDRRTRTTGTWKKLRDATGSCWGIYSSYGKAKKAIDILWYKYKDSIIDRGKIQKDKKNVQIFEKPVQEKKRQ